MVDEIFPIYFLHRSIHVSNNTKALYSVYHSKEMNRDETTRQGM